MIMVIFVKEYTYQAVLAINSYDHGNKLAKRAGKVRNNALFTMIVVIIQYHQLSIHLIGVGLLKKRMQKAVRLKLPSK